MVLVVLQPVFGNGKVFSFGVEVNGNRIQELALEPFEFQPDLAYGTETVGCFSCIPECHEAR